MTIDRRKIFTVGMVWTDFVKRLPRDRPRYRKDYPNIQQFVGLGSMLTDDQVSALRAQQQAQTAGMPGFFPFPVYPPQESLRHGSLFSILGL